MRKLLKSTIPQLFWEMQFLGKDFYLKNADFNQFLFFQPFLHYLIRRGLFEFRYGIRGRGVRGEELLLFGVHLVDQVVRDVDQERIGARVFVLEKEWSRSGQRGKGLLFEFGAFGRLGCRRSGRRCAALCCCLVGRLGFGRIT